jgi:hypothetical protein
MTPEIEAALDSLENLRSLLSEILEDYYDLLEAALRSADRQLAAAAAWQVLDKIIPKKETSESA